MSKQSNNQIKDFIFKVSAILILIAVCAYLFNPFVASCIMIIGVIGFTITTFMTPYPGKSIRGKRLYNIQILGIVFMIVATYLMFERWNEWVVPMFIAGVLISYSSILLPKVYENEKKDK